MAATPRNYQKIQKYYSPGEIIFTENSESNGIYIVNDGLVSIFKTVRDGNANREIELTRVGKNGMFGEMALIDKNKRSASVRAIESTKVTVLTTEMFNDQLSKLPPWVLNVVQLLVNRLRITNNKLRKILSETNNAPHGDVQETVLPDTEDEKTQSLEQETETKPDVTEAEIEPVQDEPEPEKPDEAESTGVKPRLFADNDAMKKQVKAEKVKEPLSKETDKLLEGLDF